MSEYFDDPGEPTNDEFEADPTTIAFLDQQQAEFSNIEDEFFATYGFKHECHCGEDYAAGRVGEITQCYHNMMQEALANCARMNVELKEVTGIAQALYQELKGRVEADEPIAPGAGGTGAESSEEVAGPPEQSGSDEHATHSDESGSTDSEPRTVDQGNDPI